MSHSEYYLQYILDKMPVLLTQVDRDEDSPTFGSCDRNYWHLKIRDFSSAILQQAGLAIALVNKINFKNNIYYGKEQLETWSKATLYFWKNIQLRDGSFNEYYPNEHGFPPTAFSLFAVCETYKILKLNDIELEKAFARTSKYLVNHIEPKAYNQEIASITALYSAYTILEEEWIKEGIEKKLIRILELQSEEGWFSEYGGADIGYLSVSYDMLAEYYWMSKDERVLLALTKLTNFVKYFVHPDKTIGGEYGSRNTIYFLPNGLEVMTCLENKDAIVVKNFLYNKNAYFMNSIDDRYNSHYIVHSYLRALKKELEFNKDKNVNYLDELPLKKSKKKYFEKSGLISYHTNMYSCYIALKKGGVIKIFNKTNEIYIDCGYRFKDGNKIAMTNWQDDLYEISFSNNTATVEGKFNMIKLHVSSPIKHFILRIASFTFGNKIIGQLKKMIILNDRHIKGSYFRRVIELKENTIIIKDSITLDKKRIIYLAPTSSLRHVASGKFFQTSELLGEHKRLIEAKSLSRTVKINIESGKIDENIYE